MKKKYIPIHFEKQKCFLYKLLIPVQIWEVSLASSRVVFLWCDWQISVIQPKVQKKLFLLQRFLNPKITGDGDGEQFLSDSDICIFHLINFLADYEWNPANHVSHHELKADL